MITAERISCDPDKSDSSSDESLGYESDEKLEYWNGNRNTLILKRGKQGFSQQVVVVLLLHKKSKKECSKKPVGVKKNVTNLINLLTKMIGL